MTSKNLATTRLADLCDLVSAQIEPRNAPGVDCLGLEHLASGRMLPVGAGKASDVLSHKNTFQVNDVLYGKLRPYLDKAVLAQRQGICTTELLVLRPKPEVDPRFLACVVHAPHFIDHAGTGVTGAHHPRTSWNHISAFELPQLTYAEQASVGALLWSVHNSLLGCEKSTAAAHSLKQATMRELFTRGLRGEAQKETEIGLMPESWSAGTFGEIREWLQYGTSVHCAKQELRYPVLRIPNIEPGKVNPSDLKYCDLSDSEALRYLLQHGDLLFIRTNGVLDRLGACAVYTGEPAQSLFASYLIRARLKATVEPRLVAYFYGSNYGTSLVASRATSAADGKYNLNTGTIDSLPLPLPPSIDEQREIVAILDALDRKIDLHKQKRAVLEELFRSLLHKLMTGEIRASELDLSALSGEVPV